MGGSSARAPWRSCELSGLLHGEIGRLRSLEDLVHVEGGPPILADDVESVEHEPARVDELSHLVDRRQPAPCRKLYDPLPVRERYRIGQRNECIGAAPRHRGEGGLEVLGRRDFQGLQRHAQQPRGRLHLPKLEPVVEAVDEYRKAVMDSFAQLPAAEWASTLPASQGTLVPTIWAELGDALGRWRSWQHVQSHSGVVPVTRASGKCQTIAFRFACNLHLRRALQLFAFCSFKSSDWARAYYDRQRTRGHRHQAALRALAAKWVKITFVLWSRQVAYDENFHLATMARQHLRQAA